MPGSREAMGTHDKTTVSVTRRSDSPTVVSCTRCDRMGRVTTLVHNHPGGDYLTTKPCPTCGGEGVNILYPTPAVFAPHLHEVIEEIRLIRQGLVTRCTCGELLEEPLPEDTQYSLLCDPCRRESELEDGDHDAYDRSRDR